MALSEMSDSFCKTKTEELELLGANYYKLPFCDEDMDHTDDWVTSMLEDRFMNGTSEFLAPHSPSSSSGAHSPSSDSSTSSSGNGNEHAYSLMTDRPDTPLTAVKIEDFSSDYPLGSLPTMVKEEDYGSSFTFDSDFSLQHTAELDDLALSFDTEIASKNAQTENVSGPVSMSVSEHQHTMDKCLSSTLESLGNNVITISKMGNTVQVKKENDMTINYSTLGSQKTDSFLSNSTFDATIIPSNGSTTGATTFQHPTKTNVINICANGMLDNGSSNQSSFFMADMHGSLDGSATSQATAKVSRNSLTHRTQIQIPTSTLQTILKSGRLITKLRQDGQFLPRIKIKTEPCAGEQYVRICQPQIDVQLPPTPPSSNTSDNEGSSSPRGATTTTTDVLLNSGLQFMQSGSQIATQLLTSPQRLTQAHGQLYLTEEEKRTLVSEGYAVPEKLPLTKTEEKALKKIRRKIKNKISAQESRRKKKEYVEALECRMESFNRENGDLKRKVDSLEDSNQTLLGQLRCLQMLVAEKMPKPSRSASSQTSNCLMVVVLCFAVFLGGWMPFLSPSMAKDHQASYLQQTVEVAQNWRARVLLSYSDDAWDLNGFCDLDGCWEDQTPIAHKEEPLKKQDSHQQRPDHEVQEGSDTYDEPTSGRVVMNDTKDQIGQVIANTMEPRDVAAVLASRKVVYSGRKVEMVASDVLSNDNKKYTTAPSTMVAE